MAECSNNNMSAYRAAVGFISAGLFSLYINVCRLAFPVFTSHNIQLLLYSCMRCYSVYNTYYIGTLFEFCDGGGFIRRHHLAIAINYYCYYYYIVVVLLTPRPKNSRTGCELLWRLLKITGNEPSSISTRWWNLMCL